jgi:mono/diheme cytochrome c family protein
MRSGPGTLCLTWVLAGVFAVLYAGRPARSQGAGLGLRAQTILKSRCAGCHGQAGAGGLDVTRWRSIVLERRSVVPGQPNESELIRRVESGSMPLGGPKLAENELKALRAWVSAGAPDWIPSPSVRPRRRITEAEVLAAVLEDVQRAPPEERQSLRYLSLANLNNNPEVAAERLGQYLPALSKLVNSLSWNHRIMVPAAFGPGRAVIRLDIRDYGWSAAAWDEVASAYPFAYIPKGLRAQYDQVHTLTRCDRAYLRADWFIAHGSRPPLYDRLLGIPSTVRELEDRLAVHADQDLVENRAVRGGRRNSGVSRNNRVVERHETAFGAYWKSFDFKSNEGNRNIFKHPLDFHFDGGELIFHLPNGLQGYMLANANGNRLDEAPVQIVSDRNNREDPIVRNGLSCIGCHAEGMKAFQDQVRPALSLLLRQRPDAEAQRALASYQPQPALDALFRADNVRFDTAIRQTGGRSSGRPDEEPVYLLAQSYFGFLESPNVSTAQAAADLNISEEELRQGVAQGSELGRLGLDQLRLADGGVKRDLWEQVFLRVVEVFGQGASLPARTPLVAAGVPDPRKTVQVKPFTVRNSELAEHGVQAQRARDVLAFWLGKSQDLRLVEKKAQVTLIGVLTPQPGGEVRLQISDARGTLLEEAGGPPDEIDCLTFLLANRVNLSLTGEQLSVPENLAGVGLSTGDLGVDLQAGVGEKAPFNVSVSTDRGVESTYRAGDGFQVLASVDRDCYLTIYEVDSSGRVSLLFPNQFAPNNRISAGQLRTLGGPGDEFQLQADGHPGVNTLVAIGTLDPIPLPGYENGTPTDGPLRGSQSVLAKGILQRLATRGGHIAALATSRFYMAR